jgi:O-antigen ligase
LVFLVFAFVSVFLAPCKVLALYQFIRLVLLFLMAIAVADLLKQGLVKFHHLAAAIAASSVFQAIAAIFQFKFFRSLGLWFLGEPVVGVFTQNVARLRIDDLTFLRSFGTLPHANILAAFLVLGLLSFYYLYLRNTNKYEYTKKIPLTVGMFFVWLALIFTFSRSGWIVAVVTTLLFLGWGLWNKTYCKQTASLSVIVIVIGCLLLVNFYWLILPRAQFPTGDVSVSYRMIYNQIGLEIIKENPFGVGIGNQLLYAVNNNLYQQFGIIRQIDWQPIHNIYILIASEIGILGFLAFLVFLFKLVISRWKFYDLESVIYCLLLVTSLLFGLVDHFPWTLQSGRLMLWLAIGLVLGSKFLNNKSEII